VIRQFCSTTGALANARLQKNGDWLVFPKPVAPVALPKVLRNSFRRRRTP
jgi:hypothetical protein